MGADRHAAPDLPDRVDIAIVGGGISGLYCALQLARLIKENRPLHIGGARHDMGFWNLLSEVLSHLAVLRIRDWGSYYHRLGNPNAAEHLIMWLRSIRSTNSLRGIRGGMELMVTELGKRLTPDQGGRGA